MTSNRQHHQRGKLLRGGALLLGGKIIAQVCSFVRNIIVARAIGVENFGIAATFSITISIIEMLGSLSVDKLLIQAEDGDDERLQAAAHAILALRGAIGGLIILLLAWPMACLFDVPEATWAFRYLALIPLLRGLVHLDPQRVQRSMNFRATVGVEIAQQVITTLAAWPLAVWLRDYSAMLWLLVLQNAMATAGSFLVSQRPFRWHWAREHTKRFFSFGWPLIVNSLLLFGVFQGDRFLIGASGKIFGTHAYSLTDLGVYSVALLLTMTPMIALSNICSSLLLPLFSRLQASPAELQRQYTTASQFIGLICGCFALPLIITGGWVVIAVYGPQYAAAGSFIGWLAAAQALRLARSAPTAAAMAYGDTSNAMYSNLVRSTALVLTMGVIATGGALQWVAAAAFGGELLGLIFCIWSLERKHRIPKQAGFAALGPLICTLAFAGLGMWTIPLHHLSWTLALLGVALGAFVGVMLILFPALRSIIRFREFLSSPSADASNAQTGHKS